MRSSFCAKQSPALLVIGIERLYQGHDAPLPVSQRLAGNRTILGSFF
jgi:hypothetical protein